MLEQTGLEAIAGRRTQKLSGGETQRVRFAAGDRQQPRPARARRADGRDGRRVASRFLDSMREFAARGKTVVFATHYLEEAEQNADRVVLMAHGRVVADGPPTEIKARVGSRTIRATLARRRSATSWPRCPASRAPTAAARRSCSVCADSDAGDPRTARPLPRGTRHRDRGRRARGGVPRADRRSRRRGPRSGGRAVNNLVYIRYELLRAFRNRRFFFFSLGFPLAPLLPDRRAAAPRHELRRSGHLGCRSIHGRLTAFGTMSCDDLDRRADRRRAPARLDRQLRITPLTTRAYFRAKVLTAYMMAGLTIVLLALAGTSLGVSLPAGDWSR